MRSHRVVRVIGQLCVVVAAVFAWQFGTASAGSTYFPPPTKIFDHLKQLWFSGSASHLWLDHDALSNLPISIARILGGWVAASLLGVIVGIALGRSALLRDYVEPLVHFGRAIPPPTLVPVFLIMFKVGTPMQVATIVFGVVWPVLLNAMDGARTVDQQYIESARAFRVSRVQTLFHVILPASMPKIFAGLRMSLAISLVLMVVAEMVGSTNGIGYQLLKRAQDDFDLIKMWDGIVVFGLLGLLLNALFMLVERYVLAWHRGAMQN